MCRWKRRSSRGSVDWNLVPWSCGYWLCSVAPLVGAWIEIIVYHWYYWLCRSLLSWERGLKYNGEVKFSIYPGRSSRGSVDWNIWNTLKIHVTNRRSSRGSVDWNTHHIPIINRLFVAPLVGAWIEILNVWPKLFASASLLSWERGLKYYILVQERIRPRRSSRGSVDWNLLKEL